MNCTEIDPRHDQPWLHSRWEKDSRYYELLVQQDLFGHWLLTRVRIPRHSATHSTLIRPPNPRPSGRGGRSEATLVFGGYSLGAGPVNPFSCRFRLLTRC